MAAKRIVIVGAGVAGLSAALSLAAKGFAVTVIERAATPGGKMRQIAFDGRGIDSGPTVFTMRWVFDALFAAIGERVEDHLSLTQLHRLARHAWDETSRLDLFADEAATVDAIGRFAGRQDAAGYRAFARDARKIFNVLRDPFIRAPEPSMARLMRSTGFRDLTAIKPFQTMAKALAGYFVDPRLRQLFGRYATYCGSSPYHAPATLMLVAHVESAGVWSVDGGMIRLAQTLADLAESRGATFVYGTDVGEIDLSRRRVTLGTGDIVEADAVLSTADVAALAQGSFGKGAAGAVARIPEAARSLSATTWSGIGRASGFPLVRHNVFFSRDYPAEFAALIDRKTMAAEPTVYVCAQDRGDDDSSPARDERFLVLINAPAVGDRTQLGATDIERARAQAFATLKRSGLELTLDVDQVTTPTDFNALFPATGGALYGRSSHGWMASFQRPGARTKLRGLYLAGGSAHPGPGVPMASLSGQMAAACIAEDLA